MTDTEKHERNVELVTKAVAQIAERFAPQGMTHLAVVEGAMKAAAVLGVKSGLDLPETARLFRDFADALDLAEDEADPTRPVQH